jgi:hypothetical protein
MRAGISQFAGITGRPQRRCHDGLTCDPARPPKRWLATHWRGSTKRSHVCARGTMLVLFETPAGYALFQVTNDKVLSKVDNVFDYFSTAEKANDA